MLYYILKPGRTAKESDEVPFSLREKTQIVESILHTHQLSAEENSDHIKTNGRILDSHLVNNKEAREYTKKNYKKDYAKKKEIDLKN